MFELLCLIGALVLMILNIYINQKNVSLEKKGRDLLQQAYSLNKEICKNIEINDNLYKNIKKECKKRPEFWDKLNEQLTKSEVH